MQTFETSKELIKECIEDLFLTPRALIEKWSRITNQTCQIRMAYPGQHLASVITGIKGTGTAARGDDLSDGSEVKSCSRADQLSECNSCGAKVLVWQKECPNCKSSDINIKTDSHWIFPIKSEEELNFLLYKVPRIILILFDKESNEINEIRLRAWAIDTKNDHVIKFFSDYYYNNYLKKDKPAPCNLHPLFYDFYLMEPKLIFHANINIEKKEVTIVFWDFKSPKIEKMPSSLLTLEELKKILEDKINTKSMVKEDIIENFPYVPEDKRKQLKMREKITKTYKVKYARR